MPTAAVIQVADAVVTLIAAAVLAEDAGATCERDYVPVRDLAQTETLLVSVVPGLGDRPEPAARGFRRRVYRIGVSVQQRVPRNVQTADAKKAWLDGKILFVEQLQVLLEDNFLVEASLREFPLDAIPVLVEIDTLYLPDELEEDKVFAAEIFADYRTDREQG